MFCHIIPKGCTSKLIRAWRRPHKITDVLQDGRLYVLNTGQKLHLERLKKRVPAPWNWATHQLFGLDQNVAIIADPYVQESHEEITSDICRDFSYQSSYQRRQNQPDRFHREPSNPARRQLLTVGYLDGDLVTLDTPQTGSYNKKQLNHQLWNHPRRRCSVNWMA